MKTLVTGAASGIGLAVAQRLADDGHALVLVDRDAAALAAPVLPGPVTRLTGDIADERFWDSAADALAGIDGAVLNAGVAGAGAIAALAFAEWRRILSVNLDGAFLSMRAALRAIRDGGAIVAVASAAGIRAEAGVAAYGAAKAGVIQLARVAAKEGAARAAAIGRDAAFAEMAALATPLGRYARADEIAGQIAFLLSDAAATITGTVLVSDGGYTL